MANASPQSLVGLGIYTFCGPAVWKFDKDIGNGPAVDQPVEIEPGLQLVSLARLKEFGPAILLNQSGTWRNPAAPRCAIFADFTAKKAFTRDFPSYSPVFEDHVQDRVYDLRRAMSLIGKTAATLPGSFWFIGSSEKPDDARPLVGGPSQQEPVTLSGYNVEMEPAAVRQCYANLRKWNSRTEIRTSIDRLNTSGLRESTDINRVLDLGIAFEAAMIQEGDSKQELSHRASLRCAWLLGSTPQERHNIMNVAKKLYDARSKAAHSGRVSVSSDSLTEWTGMVNQCVMRILSEGYFPDWDVVITGGPYQAKTKTKKFETAQSVGDGAA